MGSGVSLSLLPPSKNMSSYRFNKCHWLRKTLENIVKTTSLKASSLTCNFMTSFLAKKKGQANGLISIGQLNTLLHFHLQPIYHVVSMVSHWDILS